MFEKSRANMLTFADLRSSVRIVPETPSRTTRKSPLDHEPEAVTWARKKAGLNRRQLADRVGCKPSLITEIEKGTRNAHPAMLLKLAAALNCPVVVLERKRDVAPTSPREQRPSRGGYAA